MKQWKLVKEGQAFTLIELIAVMVILATILAITVPIIMGVIRPSILSSFESDAKLILRSVNLKLSQDENLDVATINVNNITDKLQLYSPNYKTVSVEKISTESALTSLIVKIQGQGKWEGLYACGTYNNMKVTSERVVCMGDLVPPLLTILGNNPYNIFLGEAYVDAGAVAIDDIDGDITSSIMVEGLVNIDVPGTYTITYTAVDSHGNTTSLNREIGVLDNRQPIITFTPNGNDTYAKSWSTSVNVTDDSPLISSSLKYIWQMSAVQPDTSLFIDSYTNNQNIDTLNGVSGNYYLWASATDNSGNTKYAVSNVFKLDNTPPVINMIGTNITIDKGSSYSDAGASGTDNVDTNVTVIASGTVNPNIVGEYEIIYNAIDVAGNAAIPVRRIVVVRDVVAPQITILGNNPHYMTIGTVYSDVGATALDDVDGDLSSSIQMTGTVNVNIAGTYTVTYTVSDTAGNVSVRTRQVVLQGITQYRYRTSSTSTSCSTCYSTCYNYATGTASYSCSSGTLSGSTCTTSYGVYSTFHATYVCSGGSWVWSSHYCTGNCSAPCSNGSSPNGSQTGSTCPSGSCTSGSTSCSNYWSGTCYNSTPANVTYICPNGYYGGGSTSSCSQSYSCNPYSCNCSSTTTWSNWSSWSATPVSANATTQVETRLCTSYPCSSS